MIPFINMLDQSVLLVDNCHLIFLNPVFLSFDRTQILNYFMRLIIIVCFLTDIETLIVDDSEDENALSIFETSCHSESPKKQSSAAAIHKSYLHFTM